MKIKNKWRLILDLIIGVAAFGVSIVFAIKLFSDPSTGFEGALLEDSSKLTKLIVGRGLLALGVTLTLAFLVGSVIGIFQFFGRGRDN